MADKSPRTDALRAELLSRKEEILEKLCPARDDYERLINDPRLIECKKIIKECNALLGPIENELAALARAGGARGIKVEPGVYSKGK